MNKTEARALKRAYMGKLRLKNYLKLSHFIKFLAEVRALSHSHLALSPP